MNVKPSQSFPINVVSVEPPNSSYVLHTLGVLLGVTDIVGVTVGVAVLVGVTVEVFVGVVVTVEVFVTVGV